MNKRNSIAMLLIIASSVIGIFVDTSSFMKIFSGAIAAIALAVLLGWFPIKKHK